MLSLRTFNVFCILYYMYILYVLYTRVKRDNRYDKCEDPMYHTILFKFLPIYTRTVEETPNFHVKVNNKKILHVLVLSTVYNILLPFICLA